MAGLPAHSGAARESRQERSAYQPPDCSRECLYGFVDQYLKALLARDPSRLPWGPFVRFTENNVSLQVGDGLWGTASGLGPEDARAADPSTGEAAYFGVIEENGSPGYLALRLKIEGRKISEVETLIDRPGNGPGPFGNPAAMAPVPVLAQDVPPARRRPRARMIALADGYFNTLQLNDGQLFTAFAPDCSRRENGVWTANDPHPDPQSPQYQYGRFSCEAGFKLGNYRWDDRLRGRRYPLVDEQKGLVLAAAFIDHSARLQTFTTTDGAIHHSPIHSPHSFCALELFKIQDGRIRHAEAIFITVPYRMPSPWMR